MYWTRIGPKKTICVVLSQIDLEGKEHPIPYASTSFDPAEMNYGSYEGEYLRVVWVTQTLPIIFVWHTFHSDYGS